jgi:hypothetical protein
MQEMAVNFPQIGLVMAVLILMSIGYDWLVDQAMGRKMEMYVAYSVVGGCAYTLIGAGFAMGWSSALYGWQAALITLACFTASGLPMVIGSMRRYAEAQKKDNEQATQVAKEVLEHHEPAS